MRTHKRWLTVGMVLVALLLVSAIGVSAQPRAAVITLTACQDITASGDYELGADITHGGGDDCFEITADDVTFDGNGDLYTLTIETAGADAYEVFPTATEIKNVHLFDLNVVFDAVSGNGVEMYDCAGCSITNSEFDGDHSSDELIELDDSSNILIDGNTFVDSGDDGIYVWATNYNNVVTISNNTIEDSDSEGIYAEDTNNLVISGNTIFDSSREGIEVYYDFQHVAISGNTVYDNDNVGIRVIGDGDDDTVEDLSITDNDLYGNDGKGIKVDDCVGVVIGGSGNDVYHNDGDGIQIKGCIDASAADNNVWENSGYGLEVRDSEDVLVSGNTVQRNGAEGARCAHTEDITYMGNELSGNYSDGLDMHHCTGAVAEGNWFNNNEDNGVDVSDSDLLLLENFIELNGEEGVDGNVNFGDGEFLHAHGNVICDNCRDRDDSDCEEWGIYTPVQVDVSGDPADFEHNFWCGPFAPEWVEGSVDYEPWIDMALSAGAGQPELLARGRSASLSAGLMSGGYHVPDGLMVSFATDLGWFDRPVGERADVRPAAPTTDGMVQAQLFSNMAGYATVSAWARESFAEEHRLVTFLPRKPSISNPPHKSTIRRRRPNVRWTASPSAEASLVYELKLLRLRPRPKKELFDVVTDGTSFRTPSLRGRTFKVRVRACLDDSLTLCSGWSRSKFKIRK